MTTKTYEVRFLIDGEKIEKGDLIKFYMKSDKWETVGDEKVGVIINANQQYLIKRS